MSSPNIGLHTTAIAALELAVNRALKLDPAAGNALARLHNKVLHLHLLGPNLDIYVQPGSEGLRLMGFYEGKAHTSVTGSPGDFIALIAAEDAGSALINGNITLQGDSKPLLALQEILHNLELDWESEFARFMGDVPAHELGKLLRRGAKWGKFAGASALRQAEEYLHEEGRLLPTRDELQQFYQEVDQLASATERLAARIQRLQQRGH